MEKKLSNIKNGLTKTARFILITSSVVCFTYLAQQKNIDKFVGNIIYENYPLFREKVDSLKNAYDIQIDFLNKNRQKYLDDLKLNDIQIDSLSKYYQRYLDDLKLKFRK